MPRYLVTFVYRLIEFRYAEFDVILDLLGLDPTLVYAPSPPETKEQNLSHLIVDLPSEAIAAEIQRRAILIECILELWGHGKDADELDGSLAALPPAFSAPYMHPDMTWSLLVNGSGKTLTMAEQDSARFRVLQRVPFPGPIKLKNPQQTFWLLDHGADNLDPTPDHLYLGRAIASRQARGREWVGKGDLKRRTYLGPTSLDNEMALLMASFAHVQQGSIVFDPFVGTGSILVACTQFGGFCVGTDIDIRVLRGKKDGRNPASNFAQYGLRQPELIRSDNSLFSGHFRTLELYDAIVCDPPYGIRAGARQSGSRREVVAPVPEHMRADHIPQTKPYATKAVMNDLLKVAARVLKVGGRLVYLLPVDISPEAGPEEGVLPTHRCLDLVCVRDQKLNSKLIRKMVVMRKRKNPKEREEEEKVEQEKNMEQGEESAGGGGKREEEEVEAGPEMKKPHLVV
jgi:tRNA (guanine10-N2)-methyltransferase|eukprot:evm.model.NODE_11899_length_10434_cov_23.175005.4